MLICQIQIALLLTSSIRYIMGAVFRPKDLDRGQRKVIDNAIKDFTPDTKDNVNKLLDSWEGKKSEEEKLKGIVGEDKAEELLKNMESKKKKK
jgi:hypothetical protein